MTWKTTWLIGVILSSASCGGWVGNLLRSEDADFTKLSAVFLAASVAMLAGFISGVNRA